MNDNADRHDDAAIGTAFFRRARMGSRQIARRGPRSTRNLSRGGRVHAAVTHASSRAGGLASGANCAPPLFADPWRLLDVAPHANLRGVFMTNSSKATSGSKKTRCGWAGEDPLYVAYHDTEWGVPVYDDQRLFEFLVLEGAQAGLSWITILRKREAYRKAFAGFDPEKVARFNDKKLAALMQDAGIVRNRLKIESAVKNARAFLAVQEEHGSFSDYQWRFVDGKPLQNARATMKDVPARTPVSDAFSKDLKKRGFNFVGSTIIYAHMQAVGMVNDHVEACFRRMPVSKLARKA
jgi:DNA-3-methyladenine glycosylase I